jgi:hypothetical protein
MVALLGTGSMLVHCVADKQIYFDLAKEEGIEYDGRRLRTGICVSPIAVCVGPSVRSKGCPGFGFVGLLDSVDDGHCEAVEAKDQRMKSRRARMRKGGSHGSTDSGDVVAVARATTLDDC